MEKIKLDISSRIKQMEKETGKKIPLSSLAKEIGLSRQTLMNWDRGERLKTVEDVKKLADYFKCTVNDLIVKVKTKNK